MNWMEIINDFVGVVVLVGLIVAFAVIAYLSLP